MFSFNNHAFGPKLVFNLASVRCHVKHMKAYVSIGYSVNMCAKGILSKPCLCMRCGWCMYVRKLRVYPVVVASSFLLGFIYLCVCVINVDTMTQFG